MFVDTNSLQMTALEAAETSCEHWHTITIYTFAYLRIQQLRRNIIYFESCFYPFDEFKSNIHSFSSVIGLLSNLKGNNWLCCCYKWRYVYQLAVNCVCLLFGAEQEQLLTSAKNHKFIAMKVNQISEVVVCWYDRNGNNWCWKLSYLTFLSACFTARNAAKFHDCLCQAQASWRGSAVCANTLVLFCRNIHVRLSLEARETEGFCPSRTLQQLISLISTPSTGKQTNYCIQLPVVFVWSENLDGKQQVWRYG